MTYQCISVVLYLCILSGIGWLFFTDPCECFGILFVIFCNDECFFCYGIPFCFIVPVLIEPPVFMYPFFSRLVRIRLIADVVQKQYCSVKSRIVLNIQ